MEKVKELFNSLSLREKINQMFILGLEEDFLNEKSNLAKLLNQGLGGVILFARNIKTYEQCKKLNTDVKQISKVAPFISIDQEGGLVDRFINIDDSHQVEFLSPMLLGLTENPQIISKHSQIKAKLLKILGFNMNFDPLLDVNTNSENPIISIRAISDKTDEVCKYAPFIYKSQQEVGIIPVVKHFPGHGEASIDSHFNMPKINLKKEELENIHIKPFIESINNGIEAIMVAHVNYSAFDSDSAIPASLSENLIKNYLIKELNFKGIIISDDMTMGGVTKGFSKTDAVKKAILAGVNLFIYQHSDDETINIIDTIENLVITGEIKEEYINNSVMKILELKNNYSLISEASNNEKINLQEIYSFKQEIKQIAKSSVKIVKRHSIDFNLKTAILIPDKKTIFNYSKDNSTYATNFKNYEFITYGLNPNLNELNNLLKKIENFEQIVFVNYNSSINKMQKKLFDEIQNNKVITIIGGNLSDIDYYINKSKTLITVCSLNDVSLQAAFYKL